METVSVIVPVYKVEKYIDKCIKSIVEQSYKSLQIILVNDGSPDNCPNICDDYAKTDDRIIVVHKKNGGLSDARNAGLNIATGEYILFVDSDDYIEKNMVEILYKKIQKDNADIAMCGIKEVYEDTFIKIIPLIPQVSEAVLTQNDIFNLLPRNSSFVVVWNKLYKKDIFIDLRFDVGKMNEDEFIAHKIYDKCEKMTCVSDKLYNYLHRGNSIISSDFTTKYLQTCDAYIARTEYFIAKNMHNFASYSLASAVNTVDKGYRFLDENEHGKLVNEYRKQCIELSKKIDLNCVNKLNRLYISSFNKGIKNYRLVIKLVNLARKIVKR